MGVYADNHVILCHLSMCVDLQQVVESVKESMNEMTASLLAKTGELEASERLVEETTVQLNQAKAKVSVYSLLSIATNSHLVWV